jgi:hypothetical protein
MLGLVWASTEVSAPELMNSVLQSSCGEKGYLLIEEPCGRSKTETHHDEQGVVAPGRVGLGNSTRNRSDTVAHRYRVRSATMASRDGE